MATWKKVIVSGSDAVLNSLEIGTNSLTTNPATTDLSGSFSGSFYGDGSNLRGVTATPTFPTQTKSPIANTDKFFINDGATTADNRFVSGSQISDFIFGKVSGDVLIGADGTAAIQPNSVVLGTDTQGNYVAEVSVTANAGLAITNPGAGEGTVHALSIVGATGLSNNTITKWDIATHGFINSNLVDDGTNITGQSNTSIQLLGSNSILTGSFSGSFYGAGIGSLTNPLALGDGLTNSGSTFNGTSGLTVAVGQGTLITASAGTVAVKTSNLNANQVPILSNGFLSGSNISDNGATVTMEKSLWVKGNITASGTLSYLNVQNLAVVDQFILLNSGSNARADAGLLANYTTNSQTASAFFLAHPASIAPGRWAVADAVSTTNPVTPTPDEYMVTAKINQGAPPAAVPTWGTSAYGGGNMWITTGGDIYIYV